MTATHAADIVRALVELCRSAPDGEKLLRAVRDELNRHVRGDSDTLSVILMTVSGAEPALATSITALLEKKYGRKVQLTQRANASLIGGAVLQIGDEQIDLSVRGSLNGLQEKLTSSSLVS